jgi:hypothetical protein
MATTIPLRDDLAARLERVSRERGASVEDIADRALRAGLERLERERSEPSPTRPVALGGCLVDDLDDVSRALSLGEGESFR